MREAPSIHHCYASSVGSCLPPLNRTLTSKQGVCCACTASLTSQMPKDPKPKVTASGRKTKSKKDPAAPKRPLSAYMFFSQEWRERVKAENPDAGFGA